MKYNYSRLLKCFKANPEKKHIVEKWEKHLSEKFVSDEIFYGYLNKFKAIKINVPDKMKNVFDWELLLKLIAASFSCDYDIVFPDVTEVEMSKTKLTVPDLIIFMDGKECKVPINVSELDQMQIIRLFDIFCLEQNQIHKLMLEENDGFAQIENLRSMKIKKYEAKIEGLNKIIRSKKKE